MSYKTHSVKENYPISADDKNGIYKRADFYTRKTIKYKQNDIENITKITQDGIDFTIYKYTAMAKGDGVRDGFVIVNRDSKSFTETVKNGVATIKFKFRPNETAFKKIPSFECGICYDENTEGLTCSTCKKSLCKGCAVEWLRTHSNCPYCRGAMTL